MMDTKILIIDDDPNINDLLKLYFESEGYEVKTVTDGAEGRVDDDRLAGMDTEGMKCGKDVGFCDWDHILSFLFRIQIPFSCLAICSVRWMFSLFQGISFWPFNAFEKINTLYFQQAGSSKLQYGSLVYPFNL